MENSNDKNITNNNNKNITYNINDDINKELKKIKNNKLAKGFIINNKPNSINNKDIIVK